MTLRRCIGSVTSVVTLIALVCVAPRVASAAPQAASAPARGATDGVWDIRQNLSAQAEAVLTNRAARMSVSSPVRALRASMGSQAVVDIDKTTLTPRFVGRLNGYLTGRSAAPAARIAIDYVATHPGVFRLTAADLRQFALSPRLRRRRPVSRTCPGSRRSTACPLFDNGLKANVAKDGRLINVQGSPVAGLRAPTVATKLSSSDAISAAKTNLGSQSPHRSARRRASRVLFATAGGTRPAYQVVTMSLASPALYVVDGVTGRVLYRAAAARRRGGPGRHRLGVHHTTPARRSAGPRSPSTSPRTGTCPPARPARRQQRAHLHRRQRRQRARTRREEVAPERRRAAYVFPLVRTKHVGRRAVLDLRLHLAPEHAVLVADQPRADRARRTSTSSTSGTTTSPRRRSASPRRPATSSR